MDEKIKLGISHCLLGKEVRWNGGHKLDRSLVQALGEYFEYVPVCPEVEIGLSIPREPLHLVGDLQAPRLVTKETRIDITNRMLTWTKIRLGQLAKENLCGYIFKTKSPSCGMQHIHVYNEKGTPIHNGMGLFARAFMDRFPGVPVEDEERLQDIELRDNFIARVFAYHQRKG
ncbi:MAG: DUF523 domain-containing protein [bacterium]|nr:DUF523 domain-containing protein [bacterium]